jgi:hypothetical protein
MTTNNTTQNKDANQVAQIALIPADNEPKSSNPQEIVGKKTKPLSEKAARRKLGWAMTAFCEARFSIIRENLTPEHQAQWDAFSFEKKCFVVQGYVKRGLMI